MAAQNPLVRHMTQVVERSVRAADHLKGPEAKKYAASIAVAKMLAGQVDDAVATADAAAIDRLNLRVIPHLNRTLYTLGLTPEGWAKICPETQGRGRGSAPAEPSPVETDEPDEEAEEVDALDALVADTDNVVRMGKRR